MDAFLHWLYETVAEPLADAQDLKELHHIQSLPGVHAVPSVYKLCLRVSIVVPGRRSVCQTGFRPNPIKENIKIGPPAGLGTVFMATPTESGGNPARETDLRPGNNIA